MIKRIFYVKDCVLNILLSALSVLLFVSDALGRAGGGGGMTAGGGGAYSRHVYGQRERMPLWVLFFPAIVILSLLIWYLRRLNKIRSTKQLLKEIAKGDSAWDEESIAAYVKDHFARTQEAWCAQKLDSLRDLLHPELFIEWQSKIRDQASKGTRDVMAHLFIQKVEVIDVKNFQNNASDQFTAYIKAFANDITYDIHANIVSKRDPGIFEFWTYMRLQDRWVLRYIDPADKDSKFLKPNINEE